ncbi:hypothetical protein HYU11_03170 [Candidatus Woesearchaeota archaeon]|nr:hypothetical protein [Candidatus Woesearchaeota archaeon]
MKSPDSFYPKLIVAAAILILAALSFWQSLKFLLVVMLLVAIASISTFYHNFFRSPVNFELIKFSTVVAAVAYGVVAGVLVGIISTLISKIVGEKLDHTALSSVVGVVAMAVAAQFFRDSDIFSLGIGLVVLYHLITVPIQLAFGRNLLYGAIYVGSNLLFNFIIFSRIAPFVMKIV